MELNSLLDKIDFLLNIAISNTVNDIQLKEILKLSEEHSDNLVLGRFMGYSVSDYAIATLKWIGFEMEFQNLYEQLDDYRKREVIELVESQIYKNY